MAEPTGPHEALKSRDVTVRAAAARDLAKIGDVKDLPVLLDLARSDKSPSVRLYTAASAADVAIRNAASLTEADEEALLAAATGGDPGANPSLLMVLAAVPSAAVLGRLGRILRDPRYDVRAGATTTVRRMALCGGHLRPAGEPQPLEPLGEAVASWLSSGRYPADATLELVRVVGEAGLSVPPEILESMVDAGRSHGEAVEEALMRLRHREQTEHWSGLWISWGVDVYQPEPELPTSWLTVEPERHRALDPEGERPWPPEGPVRLVWVPRAEVEGLIPALQWGTRAYWQLEGKELTSAINGVLPTLEPSAGGSALAAGALADTEGVVAKRLRARLLWRANQAAEALPLLNELAEGKKPKGEDLFVLAHVQHALGQSKEASGTIAAAIAAAPKKCAWLEEAHALRDTLAGTGG